MQAHRLHIKVAELNTPSDGNGITGIHSAVFCPVFFNEMGNKKKKKIMQVVAVARFLIFQMQKDNSLNHSYVRPKMGCLEYTKLRTNYEPKQIVAAFV